MCTCWPSWLPLRRSSHRSRWKGLQLPSFFLLLSFPLSLSSIRSHRLEVWLFCLFLPSSANESGRFRKDWCCNFRVFVAVCLQALFQLRSSFVSSIDTSSQPLV